MVKPPPNSVGDEDWYYETLPIASGFESTREAAEAKARSVAGDGAIQDHAQWASGVLTRRAVEKRMARKAKSDNANILEFVWEADYYVPDQPFEPSRWVFTPYRVVKKTRTRVYVEREPYHEAVAEKRAERIAQEGATWGDYVVATFILDRKTLESGKGARSRGRRSLWGRDFYCSEAEARRATETYGRDGSPKPDWVSVLGVEWPCTLKAVKAAYRQRAKACHPDHHGGNGDDFRALESAYQAALREVAR
jgi:hypothetical protein